MDRHLPPADLELHLRKTTGLKPTLPFRFPISRAMAQSATHRQIQTSGIMRRISPSWKQRVPPKALTLLAKSLPASLDYPAKSPGFLESRSRITRPKTTRSTSAGDPDTREDADVSSGAVIHVLRLFSHDQNGADGEVGLQSSGLVLKKCEMGGDKLQRIDFQHFCTKGCISRCAANGTRRHLRFHSYHSG